MKKLFKKDLKLTKKMENFFNYPDENYKYIGAFIYKDYTIFVDKIPENDGITKHISVSRKNKQLEEADIKIICEHFLGEKYTISDFYFTKGFNAWEVN